MLKTSNFIVEGKGFLVIQTKAEFISRINNRIDTLMYNKGYSSENRRSILLGETFFSNTYFSVFPKFTPLSFKIKKVIGLMSKEEFERRELQLGVDGIRNDYPLRVVFSINFAQMGNDNGILVTVRSEPAISYKMMILPKIPLIGCGIDQL